MLLLLQSFVQRSLLLADLLEDESGGLKNVHVILTLFISKYNVS